MSDERSTDAGQPEPPDQANGTPTRGTTSRRGGRDDDDRATVSVEHVLSVPGERLDEFLDLEPEAAPESVRGVRIEPAPGSLAELMAEIGCDPTPSSAGAWIDLDTDSDFAEPEPESAPDSTRPEASRSDAGARTAHGPKGSRPPTSERKSARGRRSRRGRSSPHGPSSERGPSSTRDPTATRKGEIAKARRVQPPRRKRDGSIPPPPPLNDAEPAPDALAALARSSLYPTAVVPPGPPGGTEDARPDERGAATLSSELRQPVPRAVAAARERAAAGRRRLRALVQLALLVAVGVGGFLGGRLTSQPTRATDDGRIGREVPTRHDGKPAADGPGGDRTSAPATPNHSAGGAAATDRTAPAGTPWPSPGYVPTGWPADPEPLPPTGDAADAAAATVQSPSATEDAGPSTVDTTAPTPAPTVDAPLDRQAAAAALTRAAGAAAGCRPPGSGGTVPVTLAVTFAPSGRVTTANILGGAFAGTTTGSCIAQAFRAAQVPPFAGGAVTVQKTVLVR